MKTVAKFSESDIHNCKKMQLYSINKKNLIMIYNPYYSQKNNAIGLKIVPGSYEYDDW